MPVQRCFPLLASFLLHGGILACLFLSAETIHPAQDEIYLVSLEEFSIVGASGTAFSGQESNHGETAALQRSVPSASSESSNQTEFESEQSEDKMEKKSVEPPENINPLKKTHSQQPKKAKRQNSASESPEKTFAPPSTAGQSASEQALAGTSSVKAGEGHGVSSPTNGTARQNSGSGVHDAAHVDQKPSILRSVKPEYPAKARGMRIDGVVTVRIVIDTAGLPVECAVHSASPPDYFEEAALEAARKTRFLPGRIKGHPVKSMVLLPFAFRLK